MPTTTKILTVRTFETIKPARRRKEIPDGLLRGLFLIVQPSGARSWAIRYRHGRRTRKHTLGSFPVIDLKAARELAAKALRAVSEGRDPAREKTQARDLPPDTVEAVVQQFIDRHHQRSSRPRTIGQVKTLFNLHVLPHWRGRLIGDIKRRDVIDVLDGLVARGLLATANRTRSVIKTMFGWALERDIVSSSPCDGVRRPAPERSRERVLSDDELRHIWLGADHIGGPYGALVKFLALTGQRRGEVANLRWAEIDFEAALWVLPKERSKNGKPHAVPLSEPALAVLRALPRIGETFVLTNNGRVPAAGFAVLKRQLDALLPAGTPPWKIHDLRRTVASGMAKLRIDLPTIEKVLNHSGGSFAGIVSVYQKHDYADEKRAALRKWAAHVLALGQEPRAGEVIKLRSQTQARAAQPA